MSVGPEWTGAGIPDLRRGDMIRAVAAADPQTMIYGRVFNLFGGEDGGGIKLDEFSEWLHSDDWSFHLRLPADPGEPTSIGTVVEGVDQKRCALLSRRWPDNAGEWWPINTDTGEIESDASDWSYIRQPARIVGFLQFTPIGGEV